MNVRAYLFACSALVLITLASHGQCPIPSKGISSEPKFTLDPVKEGDLSLTGSVDPPPQSDVKVTICDDKQNELPSTTAPFEGGKKVRVTLKSGNFLLGSKLKAGLSLKEGTTISYSIPVDIAVMPSCSGAPMNFTVSNPSVPQIIVNDKETISVAGSVKEQLVRVCVNDVPQQQGSVTKENYLLPNVKAKAGDQITIQAVRLGVAPSGGKAKETYALPSPPAIVGPQIVEGMHYIFIGGIEQSGYSSLAQSTEPFIQFYIESPEAKVKLIHWSSSWGKLRLLGAPQPSTNGIASTFTDPSGTITKQDFTKVGQSIDVVGGFQKYFKGPSRTQNRTGFIAFAGTTTPLSSQDIAYTFKIPDVGSAECKTLLSRFNPHNGYNPGLTPDPSGKVCVLNNGTPAVDLAFANQDRTSFLFKWGAGLRFVGTKECLGTKADCANSLGMLDVTVGQDATLTRGLVRGLVAKVDGLLPIPIGSSAASYLYMFGSVYTRFQRNQDSSPLILAAETNKPTIPSDGVIVLPLKQPDRDFFRLGVGLNLSQVFCKMFSSCPTAAPESPAKP